MIRRHLAVWATGVDWPLLAIGVAAVATTATAAAVCTRAVAAVTGLPAVTVATLAALVLWAAGTVATTLLLSPRPAPNRAGAPAAALHGAPGAAAPTLPTGCGVGAAHTPSRVPSGWAGRPAVTSRTAGRHHHRRAVQRPARDRGTVRYTPGRATVGGRP